jgi:pimeloyl-ACP methyl ester carboxylesterase
MQNTPELRRGKVRVGELHLAYEDALPAEPEGNLLLLTGLGASKAVWYGHLTHFGRYFRTVSMDHRDAGDSDSSPEPYTISDLAADTAGVIEKLELAPAHVLGVSMGGYVAQELALDYPHLVKSLVLVSTSDGAPDNPPPTSDAAGALERYPDEDSYSYSMRSYPLIVRPGYFDKYPERLKRLAEGAARDFMPNEAFERQKATRFSRNSYQRLSQVNIPTLIMHGADDPLTPPENARQLAARIPNAKLIIYPECGHLVTMEKSREFSRDVLAFLKPLSTAV